MVGVVGIIVYSEMCGRVAAVSKRPVFDAIRERLGFGVGLGALVSSQVVNLMTLAAEVGGLALVPPAALGLPYRAADRRSRSSRSALVIWVAALRVDRADLRLRRPVLARVRRRGDQAAPGLGRVAARLRAARGSTGDQLVYAYFVVGLLGAAMTPYEVYFYSSGAVEEGWTPKDLGLNRANAMIGYGLGGLLSFALMITAGALFLPQGIEPELLGTVALGARGAARDDRADAGAGGHPVRRRGRRDRHLLLGRLQPRAVPRLGVGQVPAGRAGAPRFTIAWVVLLVLALLVILTGIDPVMLTEYAVIFSVVALPLTYMPILLVANDRGYMGRYVNGQLANALRPASTSS